MAAVRVSELQFEQIIEIGFRQMKLSGTIGRSKRFLCKFSISNILFDKFFVLPYQQFIVQFTDNELPFIKTSGIIQQTGNMPYQDSPFVGIPYEYRQHMKRVSVFLLDTCNASLSAYEKNVYSSIVFSSIFPLNRSG